MTLENLIGRGLEREPASRGEIDRLLDKITTKLADAKVGSISLETRFDIAYEAYVSLPSGVTILDRIRVVGITLLLSKVCH